MKYSVRIGNGNLGYLTHRNRMEWCKRIAIKHAKDIVNKYKGQVIYVEDSFGDTITKFVA